MKGTNILTAMCLWTKAWFELKTTTIQSGWNNLNEWNDDGHLDTAATTKKTVHETLIATYAQFLYADFKQNNKIEVFNSKEMREYFMDDMGIDVGHDSDVDAALVRSFMNDPHPIREALRTQANIFDIDSEEEV
jgi:hypothetical protein